MPISFNFSPINYEESLEVETRIVAGYNGLKFVSPQMHNICWNPILQYELGGWWLGGKWASLMAQP